MRFDVLYSFFNIKKAACMIYTTNILFWGQYYLIFSFARAWAMLDSIVVPNDMPICLLQVCTVTRFI